MTVANYIHIVGRSAVKFSYQVTNLYVTNLYVFKNHHFAFIKNDELIYQTHYVGDVRLTALAGSVSFTDTYIRERVFSRK